MSNGIVHWIRGALQGLILPLAGASLVLFAFAAYALISGAATVTIGLTVVGTALLLVSYFGPRLSGPQKISLTAIVLNVDKHRAAKPLEEQPMVAMTPGAETPSYDQAIADMLSNPDPVDYVRVDLGNGFQWLSSRLFLLAALVDRARGANSLIFLEQRNGASRRYVGITDIRSVRWAIAREEPQLEAAFTAALTRSTRPWWMPSPLDVGNIWQHPEPGDATKVLTQPEGLPHVTSLTGALDRADLVQTYYATLNMLRIEPVPAGDPPAGWVRLSRPGQGPIYWECATWVDGKRARSLLGAGLEERAIVESKSGAVNGSDVLLWNSIVVPVVDASRAFVKALDRAATARDLATRPQVG